MKKPTKKREGLVLTAQDWWVLNYGCFAIVDHHPDEWTAKTIRRAKRLKKITGDIAELAHRRGTKGKK